MPESTHLHQGLSGDSFQPNPQAEADAEESSRVEVRHVKARLEEAEQEVGKLQERVEGLHDKNEAAIADLQHAKVRLLTGGGRGGVVP